MGCAKSKYGQIPIPWPLASHSRQEWIAWRNYFLTYMNEMYIPPYKRESQLFQYIGSIGQEISKNFYFHDPGSPDIDTLLFKFDVYFIFCGRKKHNKESIDDYIKALQAVAEKTGKSNTERIIKEKLLQDFKSEKIFEQFLQIVPTFAKITNYESLALHELMFIWEECEKGTDVRQYLISAEARKRDTLEQINNKNSCLQCDKNHQGRKCPAIGKKCWKCENLNHFASCCLKDYIKNCVNCGSSHIQNKCPAFTKECSRCKKMNHFPWQCFTEIGQCNFCGGVHVCSRQKCPAINSLCSNCSKIGHYAFKCKSRKHKK